MAQTTDSRGAEIIRQFNDAKSDRAPLEPLIRECYRLTFPMRGVQFSQSPATNPNVFAQQAKAQTSDIYDSTAPDACNTVAANFMAGLTPPNSKWFNYQTGDGADNSEANRWLDEATTALHGMIHASNFDAPAFEGILDCVVAGMFALYVTEGRDNAPFHFDLWELANCYFGASRRGGPVDIIFYNYALTAEQAANEFGAENLPDRIAKVLEKKPQSRHAFVWCIRPRQPKNGKRLTAKERLMPFESFQVETISKQVVRESGFHEFPVVVPRFNKIPGSVYATSPFANALPDTQTLNEVKRLSLAGLDMAISGMWGAVDDGVLNPKTIRIGARKIVYMAQKESFFPLTPGGNPQTAALEVEDLRKSIRRVMNADMLETQNEGPAETATAWHYRVNLIRQLLGPSYGRFQSEYLQPLVARCFGIALRAGLIGKPGDIPDSLKGQHFRLQYISPLARAQKLEDVAAMDRFEQDLEATAQIRPEVADLYDWDTAKKRKAQLLGVPVDLIVDDKKVVQLRTARAKQQQNAAAQAQVQAAVAKANPAQMAPRVQIGAMAA
ncbi:MAG TPA: portal protein [Geobacteraceae bacterium]